MGRGGFLFLLDGVEHRLFDVELFVAGGFIDEGVGAADLELRVFLDHAVLGGVVAKQHVAGESVHDLEGVVELGLDGWSEDGRGAEAAAEDDIVGFTVLLRGGGVGGAATGMAGGEVRDEGCAAEGDGVAVVQDFVDGMIFTAGLHGLEGGNVFRHDLDLSAGHMFGEGVALLVVAVGVVAEDDFYIGEVEAERGDGLFDGGDVALVGGIEKDVALRSDDEERAEGFGPDVVDIADDFMGWELVGLISGRSHVAGDDGERGVALAVE